MSREERFNSISHLIGTIAAAAGAAVLVVLAALQGDLRKIISFSIYGATLVTLYASSTFYHSLRGRAKALFQKLDHSAVYLLIAGTYTPFTLITLRGSWGWSYFGVIWCLAAAGILIDVLNGPKRRIIPVLIYLVMGWLSVFAVGPLLRELTFAGFAWLLAGGILYTAGLFFYGMGRRLQNSHGVWHVFVLAGSACQFITLLFYVL
jgi:hemolysin III